VVYGYLLPFFVVTPVASMLRLILEHAERHRRQQPYQAGTIAQET